MGVRELEQDYEVLTTPNSIILFIKQICGPVFSHFVATLRLIYNSVVLFISIGIWGRV